MSITYFTEYIQDSHSIWSCTVKKIVFFLVQPVIIHNTLLCVFSLKKIIRGYYPQKQLSSNPIYVSRYVRKVNSSDLILHYSQYWFFSFQDGCVKASNLKEEATIHKTHLPLKFIYILRYVSKDISPYLILHMSRTDFSWFQYMIFCSSIKPQGWSWHLQKALSLSPINISAPCLIIKYAQYWLFLIPGSDFSLWFHVKDLQEPLTSRGRLLLIKNNHWTQSMF